MARPACEASQRSGVSPTRGSACEALPAGSLRSETRAPLGRSTTAIFRSGRSYGSGLIGRTTQLI